MQAEFMRKWNLNNLYPAIQQRPLLDI